MGCYVTFNTLDGERLCQAKEPTAVPPVGATVVCGGGQWVVARVVWYANALRRHPGLVNVGAEVFLRRAEAGR